MIAKELRDDVLQTIIAVRLNLAHVAAHGDEAELRLRCAEAQQHLATQVRHLRELTFTELERLTAIERLHAEDRRPPHGGDEAREATSVAPPGMG